MISSEIIVDEAHDGPNLDLLMQNAITGFLRARDQLQKDMDALDAYVHATNVLYAAFIQGIGITDRRTLCNAFQAFRKALTRQHNASQAAIHIADCQ
jgi:hypothetical protein